MLQYGRGTECALFPKTTEQPSGCGLKEYKVDNTERDGEYAPAGEEGGVDATFSPDEIAHAFEVDPDRVTRALTGEFGSDDIRIDSRQSQHLVEVLLGDLPQDRQMAALITLGAYTPRPDHVEGLGEKDPAEESDKLADHVDDAEDERG